jgi:hypothetical protein
MDTLYSRRIVSINYLGLVRKPLLQQFLLPYSEYLEAEGLTCHPQTIEDYERLFFHLNIPDNKPPSLIRAMNYLREMATFEGLDVMLRAANEEWLVLDFCNPTPADIAMQIWLIAPQILERIQREGFFCQPRSYTFFSHIREPLSKFPYYTIDTIRALEQDLDYWFASKKYGTGSKVYLYHHERITYLAIYHGLHSIPFPQNHQLLYSPKTFDCIRYDCIKNEIAIQGTTREFITLYREYLGKHFFGDENHFDISQKFSFAPLQDSIKNSLICSDLPGITLVRLTELQIILDDGEMDILKSRSCLSLFRRNIPVLQHKIYQATFVIHLNNEDKPHFVSIRMPNIAMYSSAEYTPLIEDWLVRRGFMQKGHNAKNREFLVCD